MKEKIINILKYLGFAALGVGLMWYFYKDEDPEKLISEISTMHIEWFILAFVIGIASHVSRAIRWRMFIVPMGYNPSRFNTFLAVMVMYLSNTLIPRSGEVARCGSLYKYEKIPVSKLVGTVVAERIIDMLCLLILSAVVMIWEYDVFVKIFDADSYKNLSVDTGTSKDSFDITPYFVPAGAIVAVAGLIALWVFRKKIVIADLVKKFKAFVFDFVKGLKSTAKIQTKGWFIFHTFVIWTLYFLMIYVCFLGYDETSHLSVKTALVVFTFGSFGMVIPSPGGTGSWHMFIILALTLYTIDKEYAGTYALVAHGVLTFSILLVGSISAVLLPIINKKTLPKNELA